MSFKHLLLILLVLPVSALAQNQPPPGKKSVTPPRSTQHVNEGERIFQQQCSRCHTAPDGFSPHISGTIVRHMRMRASLSKHDEQELLRFFNP